MRKISISFLIFAMLVTLLPLQLGPSAASASENEVTVYHETFLEGKGDLVQQSGGATLTAVTGKSFEGNSDGAALYVSNRQNTWDAADFDFEKMDLQKGQTYNVTVTGYVDEGVTVPAGAEAYLQTPSDNSYPLIANRSYVAGEAFTLSGEFTYAEPYTRFRVQSNEAGQTVPFYIGDVKVTGTTDGGEEGGEGESIAFYDFEDGMQGWSERDVTTATVAHTTEANATNGGSHSLKVTVNAQYAGAIVDVLGKMEQNNQYEMSAKVRMAEGQSPTVLRISVQNGEGSYANVSQNATVTADGWVELKGIYIQSMESTLLKAYIEVANTYPEPRTFYLDDFKLSYVGPVAGPLPVQTDIGSLAEIYKDDFLIGNAGGTVTLQGNNLELLKQHHNVFTAENAMKPDAMYNASREFTPNAAVSLVDKALAEGMDVHGHVLIWHGQSPEWLPTTDPAGLDLETEGLSTRDAALVRMKAHITRVVETFGDKVISWDVVNEAIRDNPSNPEDWRNALRMNEAAWNRAIGSDYIEMAFRYAKEALEKNGWDDVKLYYNDYNEDTRSKAIAIASMVKELNDKYAKEHPGKLLIDGIGMQAHYNSGTRIANVQWSLETFIDLGVEVSVSELDIQAGQGRVQTESEAKTQALQYAQLFQLYKKHADNIARVTFWGINDTASWRVETSPLIFNGRMQAKQAYYAVADPEAFLEEHGEEEVVVETKKSTASYGTPTIDGTVDAAWEKAPALPISRYLTAHNGAKGTARVLWDDDNLYVLVEVNSNLTLDKSSSAVHEHDSVEVFVDQKNVKSAAYEAGVGQYRVNFDNETSFNPDGIGENVTSATKVDGTNYTVELKIPLTEIDPKAEQEIGFDVQINDGESGARRSVATWNDGSGQGYNDPSVFGVLTLKSDTTGGEPEVTVYHETFLNGKGDLVQQAGGVALTAVTGKSFEGNSDGAALHVANRSAGWHGVDFDFQKMGLKKGQKYKVTVIGYVDGGVTVPAGAEAYLQTPSDNSYPLIANRSYVAGEAFTLSGEFTYAEPYTRFRVQSNEAGQTVPFYIGDVKVIGPADGGGDGGEGESIAFYDFEDGKQGWDTRNTSGTVVHTNEANATPGGSHSLKVTVNAQYAGAIVDVLGKMEKNNEYEMSAKVRMAEGQSPTVLRISVQNGEGSYANVSQNATVTADGWVELKGTYIQSMESTLLKAYIEVANTYPEPRTFYLDDFKLSYVGPVAGPLPVQTDIGSLAEIYKDDFLIGNAGGTVTLQENNLELLKQHHNVFTAENAMKPDAMYNASREFTPNAAVSLVDKALAEGMKVHGHVLIWHGQSPEWLPTTDPAGLDLETEGLSARDAALVRMKAHITRVVETFGDKVISWDVVNEAIRDNPSNPTDWKNALRMNEAAWNRAIGPDYIEMAFRYAKEALEKNNLEHIKLYYNDYNEDTRSKAIAIASMVKELNDKYAKEHPGKLLIDGIGMQAHYNSGTRIANVQWSLETFIDLGVEVSVSELDIQSGESRVQTDAQKIAQGIQYAQLFELYKKHADNIARVTFWGINDANSWRVETSPLIFDSRMQAKPAYYAVADPAAFLEEHGQGGGVVEARKSTASFGTPTIDGTVDAAWEKAPALPISRYLTAHNGAKGTARVLWDNSNLYVLVQVDSNLTLDKSSSAVHEHDSVEVFVDQKNLKSAVYEAGVGQYRVNFDNETSFNPDGIGENVTSATKVDGTNYTVELKIPLTEINPKAEQEIGFDVQINDGESGARRSVATWNDTSGQGYNDPSVFGVLTLKADAPPPTNNNGSWYLPPVTQPETPEPTDGPTVTVDAEGRATATVSAENVAKAISEMKQGTLKLEIATGDEVRQVTVTLPAAQLLAAKQAGAERLDISSGLASVQLPVALFEGIADDATIELTIKAVDRAALSAAVQAKVGSHQVYDFALQVAGKPLSDFGSHPVKVSFPYTLGSGEQPEQIVVYYVADNGQLEVIKNGRYNAETGKVEFSAKHFSQYTAFANPVHFADTRSIAWASESVGALAARGIVNGFNTQEFGPHQQVTRAQFIQMLVHTMDLQQADAVSTYSDVKPDAWYAGAVASAQQLGIVTGLPDGSFGVHTPITRAEMAAMTYRAIQAMGLDLPVLQAVEAFRDEQAIPAYARDAVAALQQAELISGIGNQAFNPTGTATRAQAAVLLYNLLKSL